MQRYSFKVDGEYRRPTPDDAGAFYDVAIVDARIAELEKALEKYGWHDSACDFLLDELECTCGFEAAKPSL